MIGEIILVTFGTVIGLAVFATVFVWFLDILASMYRD